jgi:hypothetical protein
MKKYDIWIGAVLALATGLIFAPLASIGVSQHHDGIMLKPALDVLSGQILFRDTFTQYGPLTTGLHVLALWIEPSLLSMRLLTVVAYAGGLFFFLSRMEIFSACFHESIDMLFCGNLRAILPSRFYDVALVFSTGAFFSSRGRFGINAHHCRTSDSNVGMGIRNSLCVHILVPTTGGRFFGADAGGYRGGVARDRVEAFGGCSMAYLGARGIGFGVDFRPYHELLGNARRGRSLVGSEHYMAATLGCG